MKFELRPKTSLRAYFNTKSITINGVLFIDHIRDKKDAFYRLDEDGELQPLNYEKDIENNSDLWEDL